MTPSVSDIVAKFRYAHCSVEDGDDEDDDDDDVQVRSPQRGGREEGVQDLRQGREECCTVKWNENMNFSSEFSAKHSLP